MDQHQLEEPPKSAELRKRRTPQDAGMPSEAPEPTIEHHKHQELPSTGQDDEEVDASKLPAGQNFRWDRPLEKINWTVVLVLTFVAIATRIFRISAGNFVVWDEAHFGKFASYYINRAFYFDVHPPLGKMLVALGAWIARFNGAFDFKSGTLYPPDVPYMAMRVFVSLFGTMVVPLSYMTAVQLRLRRPVCFLIAVMTLFENGFIGISRLILLDPMLLGFTALTVFLYTLFRNQAHRPFSWQWKASLCGTGVAIGCVSSVKWVGFFVTALVGLLTIEELWTMFSDKKMPKLLFLRHFLGRAMGLIIVPFCVYAITFVIHFAILNRSGTGDANMSSLFQARLIGSDLALGPLNVAYGSIVSLKANTRGGGLLHSHVQTYPTGSKQQQITTYHHKDVNNYWQIVHPFKEGTKEYAKLQPAFVMDGDIIRLIHNSTGKALHSHHIAAPLTAGDLEVSGYGAMTVNDDNDLWMVEIARERSAPADNIQSLVTRFRLKHVKTGCYLRSQNKHLPQWGFKQGEVSCDKFPDLHSRDIMWNVETHVNSLMRPALSSAYRSQFWEDFVDCNVGMYITNNSLIPDAELEPSILTSNAKDWFFLTKGIRMSGWADNVVRFYMLGNPIVWLTSSVSICIIIGGLVAAALIRQRKASHLLPANSDAMLYRAKVVVGGWALSYFPFFIMGRVLYLHHYYPALIFAILSTGFLVDFIFSRISFRKQWIVSGAASAIVLLVFIYFSPICYGMDGMVADFSKGHRWLKSWNL